MGKAKRKSISDVKLSKPSQQKKQNPFEVHINKEKFKVLGKKSKFDKGLPGVARAKAIKKRKETLLQEYKVQDKSNKFIDRRIGERNRAMTNEDKIIARFTAERMKAHNRKSMFNLAEEEVLTHRGRSITEVERFDDPKSDDEDNDEKSGTLDANFVEEAHFGGGMFTKSKHSRESVIDQLIADSKKRKLERQQTREKTLELTEKLDSEWRDLIPVISNSKKSTEEDEIPNKGRGDSYDIALRELKFEARGKPSEKLKSEEEIAEQEAKRLEELEEERVRRMKGEDTQVTVTKKQHKSADALDDNFQLDHNEEFSVTYDQDGNLIQPKKSEEDPDDEQDVIIKNINPDDVDESDEEEGESDDESDEDDINDLKIEIGACGGDGSENESGDESNDEMKESDSEETSTKDKKKSVKKESKKTVGKTANDKDMNNHQSHNKSESPSSKLSNCDVSDRSFNETPDKSQSPSAGKKRKISETVSTTETYEEIKTLMKNEKKKKTVCFDDQVEEVKFGENASVVAQKRTTEEIREDLFKRKELMDKARKELPYTYQAPKSYEELQELFKERDHNEVAVIVERIMKCNHPKLREENKDKMSNLFAFLMQYLNDLDHQNCWVALDRLIPFLFDIMMFSPSSAAECLVEILKEKQSEYDEKKHKYPGCSTLIFLKLVPLLFPASDKRHPVTTPSLVFLTQILQNCKVNNRRSISSGLFTVSLIYEYTCLSKRICPQAVNFLVGLLHLASPASVKPAVVPPFKELHRFLYLHQPADVSENGDFNMAVADLSPKSAKIDDAFKVKAVYAALNLLNLFVELYSSHSAVSLLFSPLNNYLSSLEIDKYPAVFSELIKEINEKLDGIFAEELEKIAMASKKPKALRLYEPTIEPVYDIKKRSKGLPVEIAEREKLLHKIKREKKGALREIRRDKTFIAKIKFKQQQKSDTERMNKVKQIYGWGALQQGEMNAFNRLKKKKH